MNTICFALCFVVVISLTIPSVVAEFVCPNNYGDHSYNRNPLSLGCSPNNGCAHHKEEAHCIPMPKHINSRGNKALYCSELVEEAFKNTFVADPELEDIQNPNPFPPHKMTFSNRDGTPNSEWINYYRKLGCKEYPTPPKGQDGSNPSIMRMSHVVERVAKYEVNYKPH
ncbi:CRE-ALH-11 protein [Ditylenchus destructor]|uniref:CRE-ALH-11 protein n=1 Tax=Ditylenchus destructor TaxID=166010 RepID=A0AAD4MIU9_9BILA|nr:CRE-ALH-11 protein [Ditylenchus destructor]